MHETNRIYGVTRDQAPGAFDPRTLNKASFEVREVLSVTRVVPVTTPVMHEDDKWPGVAHPQFLRVEVLAKPGESPADAFAFVAGVAPRLLQAVKVCDPDKLRLISPDTWSASVSTVHRLALESVLRDPAGHANSVALLQRFEETKVLAYDTDHRPIYRVVLEATDFGGYLPDPMVCGRRMLTVSSQHWTDDQITAAKGRAFARRCRDAAVPQQANKASGLLGSMPLPTAPPDPRNEFYKKIDEYVRGAK